MCRHRSYARFGSIGLVRKAPQKLGKPVAPKTGANRKRGDDAFRNAGERVAEWRHDSVNLLGASVQATRDHPGAFHEGGIGHMKLMGKERAGGYAGYCNAVRIKLAVSSDPLNGYRAMFSGTRCRSHRAG